ncbi:MAG: ABC transporter ATP-binding protein, partial [Deltaproteobacteria bacterium]|nr:ABC transporter ATP-binding protein [Deltaproteobacteria bacterium]
MLTVKNLNAGYSEKTVLTDINVEFSENLFTGIIGKNGSGKSTFIKSLAGLIPFRRGEILYNGIDMIKKIRDDIVSYIPQETNVIFGFSVYEILKMSQKSYSSFSGRMTAEEKRRLEEVIEKFELQNILNRNIFSLSGGERRRVMIARGVAQKSGIVLLDEPLSGLDIDHQVRVFQILKDISSAGKIVIASVHELNMAAQFCDRIMLINNGKLVKYGTIEEVLTYSNIKNTFGIDVYV